MPISVPIMPCFSFAVCGLVTFRGVADREREFRRNCLHGLRDRLKIAAPDAEANPDTLTGAVNRRGLDSAVRAVWSGEEYLVLLTGAEAQDAEALADELRKAVLALNLVHAGGRGAPRRLGEFPPDRLRGAHGGGRYGALWGEVGGPQPGERRARRVRPVARG